MNRDNLNNIQQVNINDITSKFRSKKELYNFLSQECGAYLPRHNSTNVYFLKDIIMGEKEYISRKDIMIADVPHIDGLTVEDFLDYANDKDSIKKYLPNEQDLLHIDKKWLCNVLFTLDNDGIQKMIIDARQRRREKLAQSQNQLINMRPEFINALRNSISFSQNKGKAAFLIKNSSKRKRKRNEMAEYKQEEEEIKNDKIGFIQQTKKLKQDIEQKSQEIEKLTEFKQIVEKLQTEGVINKEGNLKMNQ